MCVFNLFLALKRDRTMDVWSKHSHNLGEESLTRLTSLCPKLDPDNEIFGLQNAIFDWLSQPSHSSNDIKSGNIKAIYVDTSIVMYSEF